MRSQARHDQIRRQIEHHVAHVEQRQARGDLVRRCAQHGAQVVARVFVHGLREPDVRADRGAQEVEDPEGGDYAVVELSGLVSLVLLYFWGVGFVLDRGLAGDVPVDPLDAGDVGLRARFDIVRVESDIGIDFFRVFSCHCLCHFD